MSNYFFLRDKYIKCAPNRKVRSKDDTCFSIDILEDMFDALTEHIEKNNIFSSIKDKVKKSKTELLKEKNEYISYNSEDKLFLYKIHLYSSVKNLLKYYTKKIPLKDINNDDIDFNNDFNWLKLPIFEHLFYKYNIHDIFNAYNASVSDKFEGINTRLYEVIMNKYEQIYPEFKCIIIRYQNETAEFKDINNKYIDVNDMIHYLNYCYKTLNKYKFGFLIYKPTHIVASYMDLYNLQLYYYNSWGTPPIDKDLSIDDENSFYFVDNIIKQLYRFIMCLSNNYNELYENLRPNSPKKISDHYKQYVNTKIQQKILLYLAKTLCKEYEDYKNQADDKNQKKSRELYEDQYKKYKSLIKKYPLSLLKQYKDSHGTGTIKDNINKILNLQTQIKIELNNIIDHINKRKYIKKNNKLIRTNKITYVDNCIKQLNDQIFRLHLTINDKKDIINENMQIINKFLDMRYNNISTQIRYGICTIYAITFIARLVEGYSFDNFINIHESNDDMLHYLSKYVNVF